MTTNKECAQLTNVIRQEKKETQFRTHRLQESKMEKKKANETAQWLKAIVLPGDRSLVPSTPIAAQSQMFSGIRCLLVHTQTSRQNIVRYKIKQIPKNKK